MIWFLAGAVSAWAFAFAALLIVDAGLRRAAAEVALALLLGPAGAFIAMTRCGPRMSRIQPKTLARFLQQVDEGMAPAWMLSYGGRGVLFVRRRSDRGWRNNVPNRAVDADRQDRS